jgi:hypothetical protein
MNGLNTSKMEKEQKSDEPINPALRVGDVMPSLQPFTGEMWSFLLVNALRCLTEEQRAGLCFDLYCRTELTESIDKKIEMLKFERQGNEA